MIEGRWRTACGANAGCVEVAPLWRKASASHADAACVEVAAIPGHVGIRDSKLTGSPIIVVGRAEWDAFITKIKTADRKEEIS